MKNIFTVAFAYIAAVIGAGFASGAEVVSFFLIYGKKSFMGLVFSGFLFFLISYLMLRDCTENKITGFKEYLTFLMPPVFRRITEIVVLIFMMISLAAMSSAAGEVLFGIFGIPRILTVIIFSLVCTVILMLPVEPVTDISGIFGVFIAVGIILSCIYIINFRFTETVSLNIKIISAAASYTAYNGVAAAVMLCSMSRFLQNKKQALITSILIGGGIFFILSAIWCVVGIYYGKVDLGEIPMLFIAKRQGEIFYWAYGIILFCAVFTTAISNGFGVCEYIKEKTGIKWSLFLIPIIMIFMSKLGFFELVNTAYRICGYASLIFPVFIIIKSVKIRKLKKKRDN